jgi:phosphatidylserine/phosphatidylglycerophosphate/cardiolipin synthase-like enzyme
LIAFPERQNELSIEKLAKLPFTVGNDVELLVDGKDTFDSIFEGIQRAENYILVQFYILRADGLGSQLKDRLAARARQGVRVCVLYDEVGSNDLPDTYLSEMAAAGSGLDQSVSDLTGEAALKAWEKSIPTRYQTAMRQAQDALAKMPYPPVTD